MKTLTMEKKGAATWITLDRPEMRNAMSTEMGDELVAAVEALKRDNEVRAVVLTGSGKAFSSGGDLRSSGLDMQLAAHERREALLAFYRRFLCITELEVPTIAVVNGHAVGAGMMLALACDLRVMSKSAKMGTGFLRIGLSPGMGGTYFLPRLLGTAKALELIWTSEMIDAEEAHRIGIANKIAAPEELDRTAAELVGRLVSGPPIAMKLVKRAVYRQTSSELRAALEYEALCQAIVTQTEDFVEGATSFIQKRDPDFKGK